MKIPNLQQTGVARASFDQIAEDALKERGMTFIPRKATKDEKLPKFWKVHIN